MEVLGARRAQPQIPTEAAGGAAGWMLLARRPADAAPRRAPIGAGAVVALAATWGLTVALPVALLLGGIGTGGGSGEFLARWMTEGRPPYELPIVDPARFSNSLSREACLAAIERTYVQGYVMPDLD